MEKTTAIECMVFRMNGTRLCIEGGQVARIVRKVDDQEAIITNLEDMFERKVPGTGNGSTGNVPGNAGVARGTVFFQLKDRANTYVKICGLESYETVVVDEIHLLPPILAHSLAGSPVCGAVVRGEEIVMLVDLAKAAGAAFAGDINQPSQKEGHRCLDS